MELPSTRALPLGPLVGPRKCERCALNLHNTSSARGPNAKCVVTHVWQERAVHFVFSHAPPPP
eukprot:6991380-Pyramimonas_sp.AAC.1